MDEEEVGVEDCSSRLQQEDVAVEHLRATLDVLVEEDLNRNTINNADVSNVKIPSKIDWQQLLG